MSITLEDIRAALVNANVGQITASNTDWFIYIGYLQDSPQTGAAKTIADRAICLYETPGEPPQELWAIDYPGVQIAVRGAPDDYQAARAKLQAIFDALHAEEVAIGSDYVYFTCLNSGPIPLGNDDLRRPKLAQNYSVMRNRPA